MAFWKHFSALCVDVSEGCARTPIILVLLMNNPDTNNQDPKPAHQIVHHYYHYNTTCSRGHRWLLKFKRSGANGLSWVKVCKRCDKIQSTAGQFNDQGAWRPQEKQEWGRDQGPEMVQGLAPDSNELKRIDPKRGPNDQKKG
jgi:hypothetical protein